jgi:hypothetical protein
MTASKLAFQEVVELVKREAKGEATDSEKRWLYSPSNRKTWKAGLSSAIEDCVLQFEEWDVRLERVRNEVIDGVVSKEGYERASEAYEAWRRKAGRYRLGLEQRLLEITLDEQGYEPIVDTLVDAIRKHKKDLVGQRESVAVDIRLWSVLDTVDNTPSADNM